MIYKSYRELKNNVLKRNDHVVLGDVLYKTELCFMASVGGFNDQIFDVLGISKHKKKELLTAAYGYKCENGGIWLYCNDFDYEALTRACLVLLCFVEGHDVTIDIPGVGLTDFFRKDYMEDPELVLEKKPIEYIKLNNVYVAEIQPGILKVGCQIIPYHKVKEVCEVMEKMQNK